MRGVFAVVALVAVLVVVALTLFEVERTCVTGRSEGGIYNPDDSYTSCTWHVERR